MPKLKMAALVAGMFVALLGTAAVASGQALPRPDTWVDGELFAGVVTPATFSPSSGNFDELYMCPGGFKDGVSLISESKPGDQDYNGGRWHLNVGTNCGAYGTADSVEDLDLGDFASTSMYFECPLLPRRGDS